MISMGRAAKNRIYLLTLYGKNVKDDLNSSERKAWRRVLEEIENGSTELDATAQEMIYPESPHVREFNFQGRPFLPLTPVRSPGHVQPAPRNT